MGRCVSLGSGICLVCGPAMGVAGRWGWAGPSGLARVLLRTRASPLASVNGVNVLGCMPYRGLVHIVYSIPKREPFFFFTPVFGKPTKVRDSGGIFKTTGKTCFNRASTVPARTV